MTKKSHKLRASLIIAAAVMVICVAVVFSLFRVAIIYVADYREDVERELSLAIGMPVSIGRLDADIYWLTPRLKFFDVNVLDANNDRLFVYLEELSVSLDWTKTLQQFSPAPGIVSVSGMDLSIERNSRGQIFIQGYEMTSGDDSSGVSSELKHVLESTSLYVQNARLHWLDAFNQTTKIDFTNLNLALENQMPNHRLAIEADLPAAYGDKFQLVIDIKGDIYKPQLWQGKIYTHFSQLKLESLDDYTTSFGMAGRGRVDASLWLDWDASDIRQVDAAFVGRQLVLRDRIDKAKSWALDHLSAHGRWQQTENGWSLDLRNLDISRNQRRWEKPAAVSVVLDEAISLELTADFLRLESMTYITGLVSDFLPTQVQDWAQTIESYALQGDIHHLQLKLPLQQPEKLETEFKFVDVGYQSKKFPSATGLDGNFIYKGATASLSLNSADVSLDFNGLFRNRIELDKLYGGISLFRNDTGWVVFSNQLTANSPHLATATRIDIKIPDKAPMFMNLVSRFEQGDIRYKSLYFPTAIMGENTVSWLDRALVDGDVPSGGFLLYGNMDRFPFLDNDGVFEVLFDVANTTLKYQPNWPALEDMQARIRFHKNAMHIDRGEGNIFGARFNNTRVDIRELSQPHLSVSGEVASPLSELLKFVDQSPLRDTIGSYITSLGAKGQSELDINIEIPIAKHDPAQVRGLLAFKNNEVLLPRADYRFKNLTGSLAFTESSISSDQMQAMLDDHLFRLSVDTVSRQQHKSTQILAKGHAPVTSMLAPLPGLRKYFSGAADWQVRVDIPSAKQIAQAVDIYVKSDLNGVQSRLPEPLAKNNRAPIPYQLYLGLRANDNLLVSSELQGQHSIEASRSDQHWTVTVNSEPLKGRAIFAQDFSQDFSAQVNLDYVDLSAWATATDQAQNSKQQVVVQPGQLPPISAQAHKLKWRDLLFSDVNLETHRTEMGMVIDHIEMHGPAVSIMGKGSWLTSWLHSHTTTLTFNLQSDNLGQALSTMGITQGIKQGQGQARASWQWHAEPYRFDWKLLNGSVSLDFEDGRLKDIEPGAGRLLGLLNFETLLSLDFGSQVSEGFAFDRAKGILNFKDGSAYTKDLSIEGKVADIQLNGRIGLSAEDYDQIISVQPGVGSTLSVLGAVAGGPTMAAAVMFVQKLLGINKIAEYKYSVKGPWSKPEVKLLSAPEPESDSNVIDDDF